MWFIFGLIAFAVSTWLLFEHKARPTWVGTMLPRKGEYTIDRPKGAIAEVHFGVRAPADLQFTLRPERWYDRLSKLLTLSAEYQVGDDAFDRAVYILSDSEAVCRVLLGDSQIRADMLGLFGITHGKLRVTHMHAGGGKFWVRMKPSQVPVKDGDAFDQIDAIAPALQGIGNRARVLLVDRPIDRDRSLLTAAVFTAICMGFAVSGSAALIFFVFASSLSVNVLDRSELLAHAVVATATIIGALVVAARVLLGRTSRGHLVLVELLTFGLLGAFATVWIELRELNVEFDHAAAVEISTQVVGKHEHATRGRKRKSQKYTYTVVLRDWTGGDGARGFGVSRDVYDRVETGKPVRLDEHPGLLGYRWIDDIRP